jgi:hypothetical protein
LDPLNHRDDLDHHLLFLFEFQITKKILVEGIRHARSSLCMTPVEIFLANFAKMNADSTRSIFGLPGCAGTAEKDKSALGLGSGVRRRGKATAVT